MTKTKKAKAPKVGKRNTKTRDLKTGRKTEKTKKVKLKYAYICEACSQHSFYISKLPKPGEGSEAFDADGNSLIGKAFTCTQCDKPHTGSLNQIVKLK